MRVYVTSRLFLLTPGVITSSAYKRIVFYQCDIDLSRWQLWLINWLCHIHRVVCGETAGLLGLGLLRSSAYLGLEV